MAVFHAAVADDDVFGGACGLDAVAVATAFDGYAVVAGVEVAAFDEDVAAAFGVASVAVGAVVDDVDVFDCEVVAEEGVDYPEG